MRESDAHREAGLPVFLTNPATGERMTLAFPQSGVLPLILDFTERSLGITAHLFRVPGADEYDVRFLIDSAPLLTEPISEGALMPREPLRVQFSPIPEGAQDLGGEGPTSIVLERGPIILDGSPPFEPPVPTPEALQRVAQQLEALRVPASETDRAPVPAQEVVPAPAPAPEAAPAPAPAPEAAPAPAPAPEAAPAPTTAPAPAPATAPEKGRDKDKPKR